MDATTMEMILTAYDETFRDAKGHGRPDEVAHREGMTAAAMCLAAVAGIEDVTARTEIEKIDFKTLMET